MSKSKTPEMPSAGGSFIRQPSGALKPVKTPVTKRSAPPPEKPDLQKDA